MAAPRPARTRCTARRWALEATKETKKNLGFPEDKSFYVPEEAGKNWLRPSEKGKKAQAEWNAKFAEYKKAYPELGAQYERTFAAKLDGLGEAKMPTFPTDKPVATRNAGQVVMNAIAGVVPELFGGAADLTSFDQDHLQGLAQLPRRPQGAQRVLRRARVRHDGDGERHGRARRADSVRLDVLHLLDYCRSALRMGALMSTHSLYVFTHDSVGLGEDGPRTSRSST
jgi:transketolase